MAQNPIPDPFDPLVALAEDSADGAAQYQAAIGLLQNTEDTIRASITALTSADNTVAAHNDHGYSAPSDPVNATAP